MSAANDAWETVGLPGPGGLVRIVHDCDTADSCRLDQRCPNYVHCQLAEGFASHVDGGQLAAVDVGEQAEAPAPLPGVAWGRFSWPLISDFMARLDQAGYIRGSAAEVGQAVILLADAAIAYEGGRPVAEARPAAAAVADVQTPRQVRMRFRVSASTVTRWRLAGELSPYLELPSGQFRYFGAVVDQLAAKLARR
jgi:hypothetical protein